MDRTPTPDELQVSTLGPCRRPSPLGMSTTIGDYRPNYVRDDQRVLYDIMYGPGESPNPAHSFEQAGPRERVFFEPDETTAAVVTCGGLCPGLNNVVRSLFYELDQNYGVPEILGIRYGFQGLNPAIAAPPILLTSDFVDEIHHRGGTVLGTSRGPQEPATMVDFLQDRQTDILFCVGGDGTQRGAHQIAAEVKRRELPISIVGIPKTIDNDIKYVWRTFGYATAVTEAAKVIDCAHTEAKSIAGGVGLVKLMGREAGFIAAAASLANGQVDFALIPEVPFLLDGDGGLLAKLERRLAKHNHAVIVVAEGAGQDLLGDQTGGRDASGNRRLGDIGWFLKERIAGHFTERGLPVGVKYLDPSYHIRSVPANSVDSVLSDQFARLAAHAAMSGKTDLLIGYWHNQFVHVPLAISTGARKQLSPEGDLWRAVLATTRQEKW